MFPTEVSSRNRSKTYPLPIINLDRTLKHVRIFTSSNLITSSKVVFLEGIAISLPVCCCKDKPGLYQNLLLITPIKSIFNHITGPSAMLVWRSNSGNFYLALRYSDTDTPWEMNKNPSPKVPEEPCVKDPIYVNIWGDKYLHILKWYSYDKYIWL